MWVDIKIFQKLFSSPSLGCVFCVYFRIALLLTLSRGAHVTCSNTACSGGNLYFLSSYLIDWSSFHAKQYSSQQSGSFFAVVVLESDASQPMHAYLIILTLTIFWMFEYYWVLVFVALGQGLYVMFGHIHLF